MKIHIGEEIEKKFQESGLKLGAFAESINTGERNVYSIFKREDISADMLLKISKSLKFNFFSLYEVESDFTSFTESNVLYKRIDKNISVEIRISAKIETYVQKFPELIVQLKDKANEFGFEIG